MNRVNNDGDYKNLRVGVLAAGLTTGISGGAERFYDGLVSGLERLGCSAETILVPADEPSFEAIMNNYDYCESLDLSSFDVVISTKAPTYALHHPRHVVYLVHTVRVFDDMFEQTFPHQNYELKQQRFQIHSRDFSAISNACARFAIGHEVAERLQRWRGLNAEVLHPPLGTTGFKCNPARDYFFLPGRLHDWKRVHLVIEAIKRSSLPMRLLIAGTGEAEASLRKLSSDDTRIEFLGHINDEKLKELYSRAIAIPFVPEREDYGYVTLEAFASGKPVITCYDSGEPARIVEDGTSGYICQPSPQEICRALEELYQIPKKAKEMGQQGLTFTESMNWTSVAKKLIDSTIHNKPADKLKTKATVVDMQPIDPPIGGGRLRLLGLYHNLGSEIDCTYIGSFDWPGESYRHHRLSPSLEEINIPLSEKHHSEAQKLAKLANGKTVIDLAFSKQGHLSPEYIRVAREAIKKSDIVVFSHPWAYPLLKNDIRIGQTVVYDSQNVEGYLRAQLLDDSNPNEHDLLLNVIEDEISLCNRADIVLACSHEDVKRFNRLYRIHWTKLRVIPNGVMAFSHPLPLPERCLTAKKELKIEDWSLVSIFIGSAYGPNVEAGNFIIDYLAPNLPDVLFVIAGGVSDQVSSHLNNTIITGALSEAEKTQWLTASDIAINPMFSDSGTNIKMFDFMAFGLPVVTTRIGARGIETGGNKPFFIVKPDAQSHILALNNLKNESIREQPGIQARECVEDDYSWERISPLAGLLFSARHQYGTQSLPKFSIVIPSYERHSQLSTLVNALQNQTDRDFEVIIIDQSATRWQNSEDKFGFPLTYYHSPVKGAIRARNTGSAIAQGEIIAFTDDDCLPNHDWLLNARQYFSRNDVVGVEGKIVSDHLNDPNWRPVTNIGFEGIGFMTANLMVRTEHFRMLNGFDPAFDKPHFREDTDFGWRLEQHGLIPYANDVTVFHPAQPRSNERESEATRNRFFSKDAILYSKHPRKYRELFYCEQHYINTSGFWESILDGFAELNKEPPEWLSTERNKAKKTNERNGQL